MSLEISYEESHSFLFGKSKKNPKANLIRGLLKIHGYSPAAVARLEKVDRSHVCRVIDGERHSANVKARIAKIVKTPVHELWAA